MSKAQSSLLDKNKPSANSSMYMSSHWLNQCSLPVVSDQRKGREPSDNGLQRLQRSSQVSSVGNGSFTERIKRCV